MNIDVENLSKLLEHKVDRDKWVKWKFSDLVDNIVEKVVPSESGLDHYIGLEHLDTGSLRIRRYGETASLKGDKLKIYAGDIIFAKRNAYLKRVAVADIDALASAHSLVLRPNQKIVSPDFFAFFLLSEVFWKKAIEISVGSLSPTINWRSLAKQEFLLPPLELQTNLALLFSSIEKELETVINTNKALNLYKKAALKETFSKVNCVKVKMGDISESLDNRRVPIKSSERVNGPIPYYGASGIVDYVDGFIFDEPILLISEDGENLNSRKLPIAYSVDEKCWVNNHSHVLSITKASRYLVKEYFNFSDISNFITGGTRPKITKAALTDMPLYLPKKELTVSFEERLLKIDTAINASSAKVEASRELLKSIINKVF